MYVHESYRERCTARRQQYNRTRKGLMTRILVLSTNLVTATQGLQFPFQHTNRYFTEESLLPALESISDNQSALDRCKEIPTVYTNDPSIVTRWLSEHVPSQGTLLGFDLESVPGMRKSARFNGPAVAQLATPDSAIVIHLLRKSGRRSKACVPILEAVLEDSSIVKAGCGIDQDLIELRHLWPGLEGRSRLELGGIGMEENQVLGLRTLVAGILEVDLPKSRRIATSDWSTVPLSESQLAYCARDAWAGAAIVQRLAELDDASFGREAVVNHLTDQPSIRELYRRQSERKRAKKLIKSLMAPYDRRMDEAELPKWKADTLRQLKNIMKENQSARTPKFSVQELGLNLSRNDADN